MYYRNKCNIVLVLILVIVFSGCSNKVKKEVVVHSTQTPIVTPIPTEIKYIEVTSDELITVFTNNQVKHNEDYKNKYLKITGKIFLISQITTSTAIFFENNVGSQIDNTIKCMFYDKDEIKKISNLNKGQEISVYGYYVGVESGFEILVLEKCKF